MLRHCSFCNAETQSLFDKVSQMKKGGKPIHYRFQKPPSRLAALKNVCSVCGHPFGGK